MAGVFVAAVAASSLTYSPVGIIAVIYYGLSSEYGVLDTHVTQCDHDVI
jgi:hypothetical protein